MADVIDLAAQYRADLAKKDQAALGRLINAYGRIYERLQAQIELLTRDVAEGGLSAGQVKQLDRYKALVADLAAELRKFSNFTDTELSTGARAAIAQASNDAAALTQAAAGVGIRFQKLPAGAIEKLLGFLDPKGPLFKRLELLGPTTAQRVSDTILGNVALGKNPRAYAGAIRDAMGGGLSDALRMARTVQIYSYREAARANYVANSDVVQGWVWYAELDDSTCPSCIAQHGSVHPLDEALNDHHNGRCTPLPLVRDNNPVTEGGEAWFSARSESEQRAILGAGRYEAFKAGKFEFGQLSGTRQDEVYGEMRVAASLAELTA